jgi:hypothetical protein
MLEALDGARTWYSKWFAPYPWHDLRLSEFPALAQFAMGPATNITFSEAIGFLTLSKPKANAAFWITAHEVAHMWWGNMLTPGNGPGCDVLSEGMAHFSTILLTEQIKGLEQRIAFCKEIEHRYGNIRQADSERSLTRIDDTRKGDGQIKYDKGGYAAWMMLQLIGRENMLAGCRDFIATWRDSIDHPALQDWLAQMRTHRSRHHGLRRVREAVVLGRRGARVSIHRRARVEIRRCVGGARHGEERRDGHHAGGHRRGARRAVRGSQGQAGAVAGRPHGRDARSQAVAGDRDPLCVRARARARRP